MLLALFKKNSMLFLIANALRVVGVIAMILLFVGQILNMKDNIEGYSKRNQVSVLDMDSVDTSSSISSSRTVASVSRTPTSTIEPTALSAATTLIQPTSGALAAATLAAQSRAEALEQATENLPRLAARATSAPLLSQFQAFAAEDDEDLILEDCDYWPDTSVPRQTGGILFTCLYLWLNICALLFLIGSEVAFPWLSDFYTSFFPPLGRDHGLGFLGCFQVYLASGTLSHHIGTFPATAAWMVFVCGLVNVIMGIIFRTSLRRTRALVPDANSPVGTSTSAAKKLFNRFSRAPASKAYASEAYHPDMEQSTAASSTSSSKRDRKVFNISAPMRETELPMYESGSGAMFSKVHFASQR